MNSSLGILRFDDIFDGVPDELLEELDDCLAKERDNKDDQFWSTLADIEPSTNNWGNFDSDFGAPIHMGIPSNPLSFSGILRNSALISNDPFDPLVGVPVSNDELVAAPFDPAVLSQSQSQSQSQSREDPGQTDSEPESPISVPSQKSEASPVAAPDKVEKKKGRGRNSKNNVAEKEKDTFIPPPPVEKETECSPDYQLVKDQLNSIQREMMNQEKEIVSAEGKQKDLTVKNKDLFAQLQQLYFDLGKRIEKQLEGLKKILVSQALHPLELNQITGLTFSLNMEKNKLDVLGKELNNIVNGDNRSLGVASLFIAEQPPGQVVFKGRPIESPYVVKVLRGSKMPRIEVSIMIANLQDETSWKSDKGGPIDKNSEAVRNEPSKGVYAEFRDIKINISTRLSPLYLTFSMVITEHKSEDKKGKMREMKALSIPSTPIIVITNESQWSDAAFRLLSADLFPKEEINEVSWPFLCNIIHRHVLTATQQSSSAKEDHFTRSIKNWEFNYIHSRFFGKASKAMREQVKCCWDWFGHVLTTIKFKRHIRSMWVQGLIFGLISKADCKLYLKDLGDFLIRFSDSQPGSFAIAYLTDDPKERIKHYLVRPEDIGSTKSLPDFIYEKYQFRCLVHVNHQMDKLATNKLPKEMLLESFLKKLPKKSEGRPVPQGYVDTLDQ